MINHVQSLQCDLCPTSPAHSSHAAVRQIRLHRHSWPPCSWSWWSRGAGGAAAAAAGRWRVAHVNHQMFQKRATGGRGGGGGGEEEGREEEGQEEERRRRRRTGLTTRILGTIRSSGPRLQIFLKPGPGLTRLGAVRGWGGEPGQLIKENDCQDAR